MKKLKSLAQKLESKRTIFFEIGIIISLSLVLLAFEWRSEMKTKIVLDPRANTGNTIEIVDITIHKKKKIELLKKPQPQLSKLEVTTNDKPTADIDLNAEANQDAPAPDYVPHEEDEPEATEEFLYVAAPEKMPEFPGGMSALKLFLQKHLLYTEEARQMQITGKAYVGFIVEGDGTISNIKLKRGLGYGLDEVVLRTIEAMPNWKPGMQGYQKVRVPMVLPLSFKLN
jgi:periplasmic protein TonB